MKTQITFTLDQKAAEAWEIMNQKQQLKCLADIKDITNRLMFLHCEQDEGWDSDKKGAQHNPFREFRQ